MSSDKRGEKGGGGWKSRKETESHFLTYLIKARWASERESSPCSGSSAALFILGKVGDGGGRSAGPMGIVCPCWRGAFFPMQIHTRLWDILVPVEPHILIEWHNCLRLCFALFMVWMLPAQTCLGSIRGGSGMSHHTEGRCWLRYRLHIFYNFI